MTKQKKDTKRGGRKPAKVDERAALIAELFRSQPGRKLSLRSLTTATGSNDREAKAATREILARMVADGVIEPLEKDKYRLAPSNMPSYEGVVDALASGSLYVKVSGMDRDIFVDQRNAGYALNGDRVRLTMRAKRSGAPEGHVIQIVERNPRGYVGEVELSDKFAFVKVDSRKVSTDIFVPLGGRFELKNGQKVAVRVVDWTPGTRNPRGEIVRVFGMAGDNDAEMHAILAEYDLPYHFEPEVEAAAAAIPADLTAAEFATRIDMRGATTFTIDPTDAKDFDDALSVRRTGDQWEVGVHIADVTHYVREGSIVDREAESRGTSVYLVDRTVPMQPEVLSNELCSLNPLQEKLTYSVIFRIDDQARVLDSRIGRTVIRSDRRFTYDQVQQIIEGAQGDFRDEILTLNSLAQTLRRERFAAGAISFEREEAKFSLDEKGKPLGVYFKEQKEANQLVEEFMLLANRTVAEFVGKKRGEGASAGRTMVYRVHDKPDVDKLASFRNFILRFGYYFKAEKGRAVSQEMNRLMAQIKGKNEENLISTLAIRTMAKAYYSTDNIGHYGLAFDYYTHFTSPIRRYPDMMVHRLLTLYLAGGKSPSKEHYEELCDHTSQMEQRAAEAERASIKYKMVEYMLDKTGQVFEGHIVGVTEWGLYVELDQTHIEGMVPLREMQDDFYVFDPDEYSVVGRRTHRTYTLGNLVTIRVMRADLARKQLDFEMVR
ncbi:ribonuclease R [Bacteroidia bacterium]|nr:ribonuclease R [Bacteroidia bacterium]